MTDKAVVKIAQIATGDLFLSDTISRDRELFHTGALKLAPTVPVLIDHDESRRVGQVLELEEWDDVDGRWVVARCAIDAPEWLRGGPRGTAASMSWINLGTDQVMPGGWRRFNGGLVREVSLLTSSHEPVEKHARVVVLQRSPAGTPPIAPAGAAPCTTEVVTHGGPTLRRTFPAEFVIR